MTSCKNGLIKIFAAGCYQPGAKYRDVPFTLEGQALLPCLSLVFLLPSTCSEFAASKISTERRETLPTTRKLVQKKGASKHQQDRLRDLDWEDRLEKTPMKPSK